MGSTPYNRCPEIEMLSNKTQMVLLMTHGVASVSVSWFLLWSLERFFNGGISNPIAVVLSLAASFLILLLLFPVGYAAILAFTELGWPAAVLVVLLNSVIRVWVADFIWRSISRRCDP